MCARLCDTHIIVYTIVRLLRVMWVEQFHSNIIFYRCVYIIVCVYCPSGTLIDKCSIFRQTLCAIDTHSRQAFRLRDGLRLLCKRVRIIVRRWRRPFDDSFATSVRLYRCTFTWSTYVSKNQPFFYSLYFTTYTAYYTVMRFVHGRTLPQIVIINEIYVILNCHYYYL